MRDISYDCLNKSLRYALPVTGTLAFKKKVLQAL